MTAMDEKYIWIYCEECDEDYYVPLFDACGDDSTYCPICLNDTKHKENNNMLKGKQLIKRIYRIMLGEEDVPTSVRRNKLMAKSADSLIAFWDGKSRGTMQMIDYATEKGLRVEVVHYNRDVPEKTVWDGVRKDGLL